MTTLSLVVLMATTNRIDLQVLAFVLPSRRGILVPSPYADSNIVAGVCV
jgi:hypothetical protein